jgi:hypothetical protein
MNEEGKDQKPEGSEHDLSEFATSRSQAPPAEGGGGSFMRGCLIALGVVALIFFLILGTCFLG